MLAKQSLAIMFRCRQVIADRPNLSFIQRQVNKVISTSISRLTEHDNIFFSTYSLVVFSHLPLQPLLPCTRPPALQPSDRSAILKNKNYHYRRIATWNLLAANQLKIFNQETSTRCSG